MSKEKAKHESSYAYNIIVNGYDEQIDIVQEENVLDRNNFKIIYYTERWRSADEWLELFEKIKIIIDRDFK